MRLIPAVFALAAFVSPHYAPAFQFKAKSIYCEAHPFEKDCLNSGAINLNGGMNKPLSTTVNPPVRPPAEKPVPAPPPVQQATLQPAVISVGNTDWRFADPLPSLVGGVNVESLSHSQLVRKTLEQLVAQLGQGPEILNKLGDSNITRVSFSVSEKGGEPSVLILVQGSLDEATVAGLLQAKLEMRRVDLNSVLLGSGADLEQALARMQSTRPLLRSGLLQEAQSMAASNDIWIAGSIPKLGVAKLPLPVSALTLGLILQKDLLLDVSVNAGSVKSAQDLIRQIQQSQKDDLAKIGASMNAGVSGSTVRVRFAMNGDSVTKALGEAIGEGLGPQFAGFMSMAGMPAPPKSSAQPAPAVRKNAVIYGLEDGPREVQLGQKP